LNPHAPLGAADFKSAASAVPPRGRAPDSTDIVRSMPPSIDTLGHSNHSWGEFLAIVQAWNVQHIIDVRSFPGSRAHPHFNQDSLQTSLQAAGIAYTHAPALGGRRSKLPGAAPAENAGWQHAAFHNFADYARTQPFLVALADLADLASAQRCALMCSEAVWWRCHRRIITDYLLQRGWSVRHILTATSAKPATLTPFARPHPDGTITYPGDGLFDADPIATP
jgi:hypothetical protein